jgi:predicted polyphosphate/ATP-dependent NAD kinase
VSDRVPTVGVIANPASGRDIRRLVAGASVFGNADKAAMVYRLLTGLGAAGVDRVLMLPAADGLSTTLHRHLRTGAVGTRLEELSIRLDGSAHDSFAAARAMCEEGVAAIVVLGGDGTHRVVAKACGETPICAISTGTNNAFPDLRETTVAGLATGYVAMGRAGDGLRREYALEVRVGGRSDIALVDVAISHQRFIGARALWRADSIAELFVTFANPSAVGLSAIAGALQPLPRGGGRGMHVRLGSGRELDVALAPGLIARVGVASHRVIELGEEVELAPGTIALDGERELERTDEPATVRLVEGPLTIDVDAVMATCTQPPRP